MRLDDEAFQQEVSRFASHTAYRCLSLEPGDLWRLADRLLGLVVKQHREPGKMHRWSAGLSMEYLVAVALVRQLPDATGRVLGLADRLPAAAYQRTRLLEMLVDVRLQQAVTKLLQQPKRVPPSPSAVAPPLPAGAPKALDAAWRAYAGAHATPRNSGKARPTIYAQVSWALFADSVTRFLLAPSADTTANVLAFGWGGHCGTGSESLNDPRSKVLLLSLLDSGQFQAAAGLVPWLAADKVQIQPNWRSAFLGWAGYVPSEFWAGAALAQISSAASELESLASDGDESAAVMLAELTRASGPSAAPATWAISALANLADKQEPPSAFSPAARRAMASALADAARPGAPEDLLRQVALGLRQSQLPEATEGLRRVMAMQANEAREIAYCALALRDQTTRWTEAAPEPQAIARLSSTGSALSGVDVEWSVGPWAYQGSAGSGKTDSRGALPIELSRLARAKPGDKLYFASKVEANAYWMGSRLPPPTNMWFKLGVAMPEPTAAMLAVDVSLGALTLEIHRHERATGRVLIRLTFSSQPGKDFLFVPLGPYAVDAGSLVEFPRLMAGEYTVSVQTAGARVWTQRVRVSPAVKTVVPVRLEHGADVRFRIETPGGDRRDTSPSVVLVALPAAASRIKMGAKPKPRPGTEIVISAADHQGGWWGAELDRTVGLPPGDYEIRVKGSTEKDRRGMSQGPIPAYSSMVRRFTINDSSPNVVDLGVLRPQ